MSDSIDDKKNDIYEKTIDKIIGILDREEEPTSVDELRLCLQFIKDQKLTGHSGRKVRSGGLMDKAGNITKLPFDQKQTAAN